MASKRIAQLFQEIKLLRNHYPDGTAKLKAGTLRWTGELQPSEISNLYLVHLRYTPRQHPHVMVRNPELVVDTDGHLPHTFQDGSLCLYKPGQWAQGDPIATTILPWTCEWLLHYEFWRATGEWCGSGGDHTGPVDRPTKRLKNHPRRQSAVNAVATAHAVNDYLFATLGFSNNRDAEWTEYRPQNPSSAIEVPHQDAHCAERNHRLGGGPTKPLPVRNVVPVRAAA